MYEEYCITMIRLQAKDEGTVVILDNICKERKPFNSLTVVNLLNQQKVLL